jgi:CRP/FNR family cyclic AMP-dependent transcriptional regulator
LEAVNVLDEDPSLAEAVGATELEGATAQAQAGLLRLAPGGWVPRAQPDLTAGGLGLLVLDGLLARHVTIAELGSTEFLGAGDLLRPWGGDSGMLAQSSVSWEVLSAARLAVLDRDFTLRIRRWPEIAIALLDRADQRARSLAFQLALRQAVRVEDRVLVALRHLADRWGRVGPQGTTLALPRTSVEVLARIVGARRQSVSAALSSLRRQGLIDRRPDGVWVLHQYPTVEGLKPGRRASDIGGAGLIGAADG